jgi:drug/metabolite transporter (DMT)-like permease
MEHSGRIRFKTRVFTLIVVLSGAIGNALLALGLRHRNHRLGASPLDYVTAIFDPWVAAGVVLLIVWLLSRMTLLSWADLSYVLPVTAAGYVVSAILGRSMLGEHISWERWCGTLLIAAGIGFVAPSSPQTARRAGAKRTPEAAELSKKEAA